MKHTRCRRANRKEGRKGEREGGKEGRTEEREEDVPPRAFHPSAAQQPRPGAASPSPPESVGRKCAAQGWPN